MFSKAIGKGQGRLFKRVCVFGRKPISLATVLLVEHRVAVSVEHARLVSCSQRTRNEKRTVRADPGFVLLSRYSDSNWAPSKNRNSNFSNGSFWLPEPILVAESVTCMDGYAAYTDMWLVQYVAGAIILINL